MGNKKKFTWTDKTDPEIYNNGATIVTLVSTTSEILQPFIEEVSHKIGIKLDFRQTCGRYFVMVKSEEYKEAIQLIEEFQIDWSIPCDKEVLQVYGEKTCVYKTY